MSKDLTIYISSMYYEYMELLKEQLVAVGLTPDEIVIYLSILDAGSDSILHLSQNTGIPRTTVYLLIESLVEKKIVSEVVDGKKKRYTVASPQEIVVYAQNKKKKLVESIDILQKELPQLQALYNLNAGKPRVRYYTGKREVKRVFDEALTSEEIFLHCMSLEGREIMGDILDEYIEQLAKKLVFSKQIISDSKENQGFKKQYETARNQIMCLENKYMTSADYILFGTNVAYMTYTDSTPHCVLIDDPHIAHFEKVRFNLLWEHLQKLET